MLLGACRVSSVGEMSEESSKMLEGEAGDDSARDLALAIAQDDIDEGDESGGEYTLA